MAKQRKRGPRVLNTLAMPTVLFSGVFAFVADRPFEAAIVGALLGLVVGIGILAFPDLDRGGPADNDDMLH
jgi:hypothetical protein